MQSIVQMEENPEPKNTTKRYFVELDVRDNVTGELFRVSEYFLVHSNLSHCLLAGYEWNKRTVINMVLVVRNQDVWVRYLIDTINSKCYIDH